MNTTLKGTVRYEGGPFAGWQTQPGRRTVQEELENALSRIAPEPVQVQGASRTDAGVHAFGQVFSCLWPGAPPSRLRHAVSKMLAPEIRVTKLEAAASDFNARFSAASKRYAYTLDCGPEADPFSARYAWHVPYALGFEVLHTMLGRLEGRHDFAAFQSAGGQAENTMRTLHTVRIERGGAAGAVDHPDLWRIEFHGDAFLYKMVRNLTGTLIEIARGRFPAAFLDELMASRGPFLGHCAPAHGLTLLEVRYE